MHSLTINVVLGLYIHKRTAATHIFVVIISTEVRTRKPYALPIQCFSYSGLGVAKLSCILNKILNATVERNMDVNGEV